MERGEAGSEAGEELGDTPNYGEYEKSPLHRGARGGARATAEKLGEDYFDIPAFLRRQAD